MHNAVYQLITYLLRPYVFIVLLLGLAIVRLLYKRPEVRRGLIWVVVFFLLLVVLSTPAVGYLALGSLEWQYMPQEKRPKDAEAIVVLDGGGIVPEGDRQRAELSPASLSRTLHAAELYHQAMPCLVLVSGGSLDPNKPGPTCADVMADLLVLRGVRSSDVVVENKSRNTYENAVESSKLLKEHSVNRIVLVTDAIHLPRAVRCFRKQGFEVYPSGCRYRTGEFKPTLYQFLPSVEGISDCETASYESLGLAWYWLTGRI